MNRLETSLRRKLPALQKNMRKIVPQSVVDSLKDEADSDSSFSSDSNSNEDDE